jgi:hypothetical protein
MVQFFLASKVDRVRIGMFAGETGISAAGESSSRFPRSAYAFTRRVREAAGCT